MIKNKTKLNPLNLVVTAAILLDLMFPKSAARGATIPEFEINGGAQSANISKEVRLTRSDDAKPRKVIYVIVTAYSSTPDQTDSTPFITANGTHVHDGTLAANFLSFGTKVRLPDYFGDKIFVVEDRMNRRYSYRADVWMETREVAKQFGVRRLKMEIY